nr:hypothetical protein [Candidatus Magasanikbacteria bacterium]
VLSLRKIKYTQNQRQEVDGSYYYNWEKKFDVVSENKVSTDSNGNYATSLTPPKEGEYELVATGTDKRGNVISTTYQLYVSGEEQVDVRPTNDSSLDLVTEKVDLNVGDTGKIIIKSPYAKAKALIAIERGKIFSYKIVDLKSSLYEYTFKADESFIPNVNVSVLLLSSKPEVKFGTVYFTLNTKEKNLQVTVTSDKKDYLPGEQVKLHFSVKDSLGKPVVAEFSAAVVDQSVLALKGNPKKNPVQFFYDGFPLTVATASNVKNILQKLDVPNGTKGGGGGSPEDLAKKKRGVFKDTALWQAVLKTDANGQADAKFTLPDNLTTWQVEAVGVTKDTKLGVGYSDFMSKKQVMVSPVIPRFVVPGDDLFIGAQVFNQTQNRQTLSIGFSSESLKLVDDKAAKSVTLSAGESKLVYFHVAVPMSPTDGAHILALSAANKNFNDTVEQKIKIVDNSTYEATANAGYGKDPNVSESVFVPSNVVPNKGEMTVRSSATLAVFLSDALKYLFNYPYGSTEEIASKLQGMAIVKRSINLPNVSDKITLPATVSLNGSDIPVDEAMNRGIREIFKAQNSDGGFLYYPVKIWSYQENSDVYLTLRVADALVDIKNAGYTVDNERLRKVKEFLTYRASLGGNQKLDDETFIVVAKTLSDLKEYGNLDSATIGRIKTILRNNKFLKEQVSNQALGNLAVLLAREQNIFGSSAMNTVIDLLENRIQIDARGAYVAVNAEHLMWQYYETPVQDTSLLLQALVAAKRDDQILDRLVRWLVASRAKDGSWGSTVDTVTVVDTFSQFIAWRQETESNFTLKTLVDKVEKNSFTFKPETIFSQNQMVFPISDLAKDRPIAITFAKENIPPSGGMPRSGVSNNFYYDIALRYFLPIDQIAPRDEGFTITRNVYARNDLNYERPLTEGKVGDVLRVHGEIIVPRSRNFVTITDPIPAGASIVNTNLATEDQSLGLEQNSNPDNPRYIPFGSGALDWQYLEPKQYQYLYTDITEARDDRFYAAVTHLEPGTYAYDYDIRLLTPGTFHYLPAVVSESYFPENFGRTSGRYFTVKQ